MSTVSPKQANRRGRLFPESTIPQEELDRIQVENDALLAVNVPKI